MDRCKGLLNISSGCSPLWKMYTQLYQRLLLNKHSSQCQQCLHVFSLTNSSSRRGKTNHNSNLYSTSQTVYCPVILPCYCGKLTAID